MKKARLRTITFVIIFIISTLSLIGLGTITSMQNYSEYGLEFSKGWKIISSVENNDNYTLSNKLNIPKDEKCIITKNIPDNLDDNDTLFFSTQSIAFTVYVAGEEIYEYGYDTGRVNSSPGDFVHFIKLPKESEGKELKLEIDFPYSAPSLMINRMNIVDGRTMLLTYERSKIIPLIICIFMDMLGIVCIVCEIVLFKRVYGNNCLIYMGAFLMFLATWSISQIKIIPILLGGNLYHSSLSYIALSLLPVPLVMFAIERYNLKKNRISKIIVTILTILFVFIHILNVTGIWDYAENVVLTQGALVLSSFFYVFVTKKFSENVKNEQSRKLMSFAISFLVLSGIFDISNYYTNKLDDYSFYSRLGLLIFVLCIFSDVMLTSVNMVKLGEASERNRKLAITDAMTGMNNRTAYSKMIENMRKVPKDKLQFGVITFDVNNLKRFNDSYGHNMGDTLIIESGRIINSCCVELGIPFRQGGDEFTILVFDNPAVNIDRIIANFQKMLVQTNERLMWTYPISIAYGYTLFHPSDDMVIEDAIVRADRRMYEMKGRMKDEMMDDNKESLLENERNRIAQRMHDTTGHTLTMIQSLINIMETEQMSGNDQNTTSRLTQIRELAENGIKELRHSINNIKESDDNSLTVRINQFVESVEEINIEVCIQGNETAQFEAFSEAVCENVREAVTNCLRHSQATHMDIIVKFLEESLEVYIFDNGQGCEQIVESDGLVGIKERIAKFGGVTKFSSIPGEGFQITMKILL